MATCTSALPASLLDVLRQGTLTEEQARMIYEQGPEAVLFADESGWRVAADAIRLWRGPADPPAEDLRFAPCPAHDAIARGARYALEGPPRQAADQAPAPPSERLAWTNPTFLPTTTRPRGVFGRQ